jgi:hypothetical protein
MLLNVMTPHPANSGKEWKREYWKDIGHFSMFAVSDRFFFKLLLYNNVPLTREVSIDVHSQKWELACSVVVAIVQCNPWKHIPTLST